MSILSTLLEPRYTFRVHMVQIFFIVIAILLSIGRALIPNVITTRANVLAITMGIKSLVIILYQVLTEHTYRFRKWASLKANAILNTMEIAFWFVVVIITFITNTQRCSGMSCVISWVVGLLAAILTALAVLTSVTSIKDFRHFKKLGVLRGSNIHGGYNSNSKNQHARI